MNKSELKDLVKGYFNLEDKKDIKESVSTEEVKFQSAKLVDGTPITNGEDKDFEVGDHVMVTTEAGDSVLAPSGEHVLEDGITLVIDGEGVITGLHKPDESGQGSLSKEEASKEKETEVELADDAINESDALPMAEHEDEDHMDEHKDEQMPEIIEAIMAELAPTIKEMKKKLAEHEEKMAEHEEKMKEHYAAAEETSVTEKAFSKAGFGSKPEGDMLSFNHGDIKKMQYANILSMASKNNKN
tara:strand:- start:2590 stop:3318 length:729 start_codon:yes stop_codon:yes gene_type:complete